MTTQAWRVPSQIGRTKTTSTVPAVANGPSASAVPAVPADGSRSAIGRRRRTPGEIVALLRQADELLTRGCALTAVIDAIGVSEATFHRWRAHYGGIKAEDARRLRELEKENRDLVSLVANQSLDILMLRQALSVDVLGPRLRSSIVRALRAKFDVSERRACEVIGQPRSSQRRMIESHCRTDDPADPDGPTGPTGRAVQLDDPDDEPDYAELAAAYPAIAYPAPACPAPDQNPTEEPPTPWSAG